MDPAYYYDYVNAPVAQDDIFNQQAPAMTSSSTSYFDPFTPYGGGSMADGIIAGQVNAGGAWTAANSLAAATPDTTIKSFTGGTMDPLIGGVSQDVVEVYDPGIPAMPTLPPLTGGVDYLQIPGNTVTGTQTAAPQLTGGIDSSAYAGGNTFNQTYSPTQTYAPQTNTLNYTRVPSQIPASQVGPSPVLQSSAPQVQQFQPFNPEVAPMQTPDLNPRFGNINIPPIQQFQQPQPSNNAAQTASEYINAPAGNRQFQIGARKYNASDLLAQAADQGVPNMMSDAGPAYAPPRQMLQPIPTSQAQYDNSGMVPQPTVGAPTRMQYSQVPFQEQPQLPQHYAIDSAAQMLNYGRQQGMAPPPVNPFPHGWMHSPYGDRAPIAVNRAQWQAYGQDQQQRNALAQQGLRTYASVANSMASNEIARERLNFDQMKEMQTNREQLDKATDAALLDMDKRHPLFPEGSESLKRDPLINEKNKILRRQYADRALSRGLFLHPWIPDVNYDVASQIDGRLQRTQNSGMQGEFLGKTMKDRIALTGSRAKIAGITAKFLEDVNKDRVKSEASKAALLGLKEKYGEDLILSQLEGRDQALVESAARIANQDLDNNLAIIGSYRSILGNFQSHTRDDIELGIPFAIKDPTTGKMKPNPAYPKDRAEARARILQSLKSFGPVTNGVPQVVGDAYASLLKSTHPTDPAAKLLATDKAQEANTEVQQGIPKLNVPPPPQMPAGAAPVIPSRRIDNTPVDGRRAKTANGLAEPVQPVKPKSDAQQRRIQRFAGGFAIPIKGQ